MINFELLFIREKQHYDHLKINGIRYMYTAPILYEPGRFTGHA